MWAAAGAEAGAAVAAGDARCGRGRPARPPSGDSYRRRGDHRGDGRWVQAMPNLHVLSAPNAAAVRLVGLGYPGRGQGPGTRRDSRPNGIEWNRLNLLHAVGSKCHRGARALPGRRGARCLRTPGGGAQAVDAELTNKSRDAISAANDRAVTDGHPDITPAHLLLALLAGRGQREHPGPARRRRGRPGRAALGRRAAARRAAQRPGLAPSARRSPTATCSPSSPTPRSAPRSWATTTSPPSTC